MTVKLRIEKAVHKSNVEWIARLFVDGKHVGTLEFDEIELVGKDLVIHKKDTKEDGETLITGA
jgi:hypothetical protein